MSNGGCAHNFFAANAMVNKMVSTDGGSVEFSMDVTVKCAECEHPFIFVGLPVGASTNKPMASFLGEQLRAPIRPANIIEAKTLEKMEEENERQSKGNDNDTHAPK